MEFSDLALAKFLQTSPELGPLIVNFSELTDEMQDSNTGTRVGIFILKAGAGIITVPVIAKGDTIFPIDSVFMEDEKKFKPLSNSTTSYILNSTSKSPGKVTKIPDTVETNPNLQNLINPPRTGKFSYASTSRLTEFLAILPDHVKKFAFEKIAAEQSVYNTLDHLFGLKAIFTALNGRNGGTGVVNSVPTGGGGVNQEQFSVVTSPVAVQALMNDSLSKTFLEHGYVVTGSGNSFRSAIAYQPFNKIGTYTEVNYGTDGGREFDIVFRNGSSKRAYVPKFHISNSPYSKCVIFEDGTSARGAVITNGQPAQGFEVLKFLFETNPPKLLKDLERGERFVLFTNSGEVLGPFDASSVTRNAYGTEVRVYAGPVSKICGYQNFTKEVEAVGDTMFVPSNVIVLSLGEDVSEDVEVSINDASRKKELVAAQFLHSELDLRHDGVEFSTNGIPVGGFPLAMKYLVEQESIEPETAQKFLKQAEEVKFVKLFLSKKASTTDFNPTQVPQYGSVASRYDEPGLNGSFMPAVQSAAGLDDSQALESTIIAQLLQVPELFEYIQEYLPEIEETIDKLGRILFLTRVKIDQISEGFDSDSVYSMIGQIKTVYRQLGDTSLKLKSMAEVAVGFDREKIVAQTNGQ